MTTAEIVFSIYIYAMLGVQMATLWRIFEKAGIEKWKGLVPGYNLYIWLKIMKKPWWWLFLFLIDGVNLLMIIIMNVETSRTFGKFDYRETLKMILLPHWGLIQIAFGDAKYFGQTDWSIEKHRKQRELSDHVALFFSLPVISHAIVYLLKLVGSKDKPRAKSMVKEWGDAILFAIIAAAIIRRFFFEPFTIPTPSMEKDLLVGDYLFVSKVAYGAQWANTPLSIPFFHNRIPFLERNSYVEWIKRPYFRLPGLGSVERNDIVVFNFPAGDTAINDPGVDGLMGHTYKQWQRDLAFQMWLDDNGTAADYKRFEDEKQPYMKRSQEYFEETFGLISRPVDKRENYIKRCVGIPGDKISVKERFLYVNGKKAELFEDLQYNYYVKVQLTPEEARAFSQIENTYADTNARAGYQTQFLRESRREFFKQEYGITASHFQVTRGGYDKTNGKATIVTPLTFQTLNKIEKSNLITKDTIIPSISRASKYAPYFIESQGKFDYSQDNQTLSRQITYYFHIYPNHPEFETWTEDHYGPIIIPYKGWKIPLTEKNWILYKRCIGVYEGHEIGEKDGKYYVDGKAVTDYTFELNYYWMMGDNRQNSADSRFWGFVPEDHIVGKAVFIWMSIDEDGLLGGGIRWNRIFTGID